MDGKAVAQVLKIAGLAVIGLVVAFLLFMGIGEMASGDLSGASHVIPAVVLGGLAALSFKTARAGGAVLAVLGALIGLFFYTQTSSLQARLTAIMLTGGPLLVGGLLLLASAAVAGRQQRA